MAEFIEKQEALDGMRQLPHEYKTKEQRARTGGIAACQMVVKNIEPADVRPVVRGRWIEWWPGDCALIMTGEEMLWMCSECTAKFSDQSSFCPNCGADMREEEPRDGG